MYQRLATTIVVFLCLFGLAALPSALGGMWSLPWQWAWVQQVRHFSHCEFTLHIALKSDTFPTYFTYPQLKVTWEGLNFAVLVAVCIVCLPSDTSRSVSAPGLYLIIAALINLRTPPPPTQPGCFPMPVNYHKKILMTAMTTKKTYREVSDEESNTNWMIAWETTSTTTVISS